MNFKNLSTEKQEAPASEIVDSTIGLKKAISPVCRIKPRYAPRLQV